MELPFLPTFTTVYELGNLTRAAAALHRTQPTVSYQLRRLEAAMGQPLFLRQAARCGGRPPLRNMVHAIRRAGTPENPGLAALLRAVRSRQGTSTPP